MKSSRKYILINDLLTHLSYGIWAFLALWFFQERLYSDAGFFISKVVHYESFWMELNRFMRVFSQWLPLVCIKLNLDLKTVLLAYSLGHVLFFYAVFLFGRYRLKNHFIGWLLILTQTVGILWGFCAPGYELYYVTAFLAVFAVVLNKNEFSPKNIVFLFLLIITMVVNYQLIIFMVAGIVLLHFEKHKFKYLKLYAFIAFSVLACFVFKQSLTAHSYEVAKMENFILNLTSRSYGWNDYILPLLSFYYQYYLELGFIACLTFALYLKDKKYLMAVSYLLFLLLTQYIIALTYPGIRHSRYQEQCFYPLIFVTCFPLLMDLKNKFSPRAKWILTFSLFSLVVYRFVAISVNIKPFTHRVDYMHRIIMAGQKMEGNKFIMKEDWWNPLFAGTSFTLGMESMLISGLDPDRKTIHIIRDTEWYASRNAETLNNPNLYMFTYRSFYDRTDSIYNHKSVNSKYFDFPPGKYRFLNGNAPPVDSISYLHKNLNIKTYTQGHYTVGSQANVLIKLINEDTLSLNSAQIKIGYHWWKDGKIVFWEGIRNHLEIDLLPKEEYYQYIMVQMPPEPGNYELQVDPIAGDSLGWMNFNRRVSVIVE